MMKRNRLFAVCHQVSLLTILAISAGLGIAQNQNTASHPKFPAAVIVLKSNGFTPPTITHRAGYILFIIHDESGEKQLNLHLKSQAGPAVHDVPVSSNRHDWQELVNLPAGQYTLTEDGHSKWTCLITIK